VTVAAATVLGVGAGVGIGAAPALAKGADQATITGPGLQHPIVLGGLGEPDTDSTLAQLAEGSGLFPAMFGPDAGSALVADRPAGSGPATAWSTGYPTALRSRSARTSTRRPTAAR
jgi:hypothetical protein